MILPVIVIFLLTGILSFYEGNIFLQDKDTRKAYNLIFYLLSASLVIISTFRSADMRDYSDYVTFFMSGSERMEIGNVLLVWFLSLFTKNVLFYFGTFALISISLRMLIIKKTSPFIYSALMIYVSDVFILHDMIQIRCAIASSLLLWAVYYKFTGEKLLFFIIAFIAVLFHYSAIIIIPLYFLKTDSINKWFWAGILFVSFVLGASGYAMGSLVSFVNVDAIQLLYVMHTTNQTEQEINIFNILQLIRCAYFLLILFYAKKICLQYEMVNVLLKIYCLALVSFYLLSDIPAFAFRVSEFYFVVEILLFPSLILMFKEEIQFWGKLLCISFGFIQLFFNIFYNELLL